MAELTVEQGGYGPCPMCDSGNTRLVYRDGVLGRFCRNCETHFAALEETQISLQIRNELEALRAREGVVVPRVSLTALPQKAVELLTGGGIDNLSLEDKQRRYSEAINKYARLLELLAAAPKD